LEELYSETPSIPSDIEISQNAVMKPIAEISQLLGVKSNDLEQYGKYKAKIEEEVWENVKDNPDGKLILVTAITPTPAGEGKTCTSIGLAQAFGQLGVKHALALREPSMGPTFGIKGGAAGGGYSQVLPMEDIIKNHGPFFCWCGGAAKRHNGSTSFSFTCRCRCDCSNKNKLAVRIVFDAFPERVFDFSFIFAVLLKIIRFYPE